MSRRRLLTTCAALAVLVGSPSIRPAALEAQANAEEAAQVLLDAARSFQSDGRNDVARAVLELILRDYSGTFVARQARTMLDGLSPASEPQSPGDGSTELTVWSTTYGLFLGVAIPTALGADDSAPYGVGLLLGGPGGFLLGRALAGSRNLTVGQARAITFGGTWGTWQGAGWRDVLGIGTTEICDQFGCRENESSTEETFAAMIAGGVAGIVVGSAFSRKNVSSGTATAVNFGALWGTWFGFATGVLLDLHDDTHLAATLIGGDAGLLYTAIMAPRWNVTRNRARIVSIAGVIGALAGGGLNLIAEPDNEKALVGVPFATSLIGLAFGAVTTREAAAASGGEPDDDAAWDGALLSLADGRWRLDAPLPFPVMPRWAGPNGRRPHPGLGLTLLSARF